MARKISGTFCERTERPRGHFDRRSFRWKQSNGTWILIGCPRGKWSPSRGRCRVGTRAHKILEPVPRRGRCPRGEKKVSK